MAGLTAEEWLMMWDCGNENKPSYDCTHHQHHCSEHSHDSSHCSQCGHKRGGKVEEHGHGTEVDKFLIRYLSHLTGNDTEKVIFVSLSGNTLDLGWLCDQGYSVVGAEISETAVKGSFSNAPGGQIPYEVVTDGGVKCYSATDGKKLKVYVDNFFSDALVPESIGMFDCIWDCHGIISIPISQQHLFAKKLFTFLKPCGKMLFSTVNYDLAKLTAGPAPAPVPASQLQELFPKCEVKLIADEPFPYSDFEGVDKISNPVVLVTSTCVSD